MDRHAFAKRVLVGQFAPQTGLHVAAKWLEEKDAVARWSGKLGRMRQMYLEVPCSLLHFLR